MNTERKKIKEKELCWFDFYGKIDSIISDLQRCKKEGWEGIDYEYDYDNQIEYYVYKERLETDEEYNLRMSEEKFWKEYRRKQYETLKKEFET
jgi:hypothetical protein